MKATNRKNGLGVLGVGAAACGACCAGPVLGFLAAAGLFTVAGIAMFGVLGLVALVPVALWWLRRRRRPTTCAVSGETVAMPVAVELTRHD